MIRNIAILLTVGIISHSALAGFKQPFAVSKSNLSEHEDQLTEGHKRLLSLFDGYEMRVLPSSNLPLLGPDSPALNGEAVRLKGPNVITGYKYGTPFPNPSSGIELIWNHRLRWRGKAYQWKFVNAEVSPEGRLTRMEITEQFYDNRPVEDDESAFFRAWIYGFPDGRFRRTNQDGVLWLEKVNVDPGSRIKWDFFAQSRHNRIDWTREESYYMGGFFIRHQDMINMMSREFDKLSFKLLGKTRKIVPYSDGRSAVQGYDTLSEMAAPHHPDQEFIPYQIRSVWVVEAFELEPGVHPSTKRRYYIDPASWAILLSEHYDSGNKPRRVHECVLTHFPDLAANLCAPQVIYALDGEPRYMFANFPVETGLPSPRLSSFTRGRVQAKAQ